MYDRWDNEEAERREAAVRLEQCTAQEQSLVAVDQPAQTDASRGAGVDEPIRKTATTARTSTDAAAISALRSGRCLKRDCRPLARPAGPREYITVFTLPPFSRSIQLSAAYRLAPAASGLYQPL